ncbi:DUF2156 domain-containing protein [Candidatus Protochlamydia amoebophila]|uniref:Phosphatidylglycerol lysyltransferase C-terminal domain-containing protein n=1 Tax=Protochlamydia amoebophila (strain UWE25) TaxID=264201 RepID=Q6MCQ2_PARUW|nr:phosphatidylglycerol lysyltransferase domain-containing protein [Candidatus Protochlamydia amoebophila]CAF23647.1 unnamed protein product [Candidatus Protochlamydia amoebophila UWE25]
MRKEPLNLSHQTLLTQKFRQMSLVISEYSFANLYLFRKQHEYEVIFGEDIYIKGIDRGKLPFMMLTSIPHPKVSSEIIFFLNTGYFLFPIPEEWNLLFDFPLDFSFEDADSDYLFKVEKLAFFSGRHLSKKRNLVKQLFDRYQIKTAQLTQKNKSDALKILVNWQDQQTQQEQTDYFSCLEAIKLLECLNLEGVIIYIDGKPAGFTIGEYLTPTCFVIHFAKGDANIHGLYQYLYQYQAQILSKQTEWINLEQDLGLPFLRQAKHSYVPDRMILKQRARDKNKEA